LDHQGPGKEKKKLALHVVRDFTPSLFIAVNGFDGNPQELGHFLLGLIEFRPDILESAAFHAYPLFRNWFGTSHICLIKYTTEWELSMLKHGREVMV
jgi:hypothetical protein